MLGEIKLIEDKCKKVFVKRLKKFSFYYFPVKEEEEKIISQFSFYIKCRIKCDNFLSEWRKSKKIQALQGNKN